MLFDNHHRVHDYLRISLTDSCNLRCSYCMPDEKITSLASKKLMQPDEIEHIVRVFVGLGVKKIRLTGGEPLVRKEADDIIRRMGQFPVNLTITTNGVMVNKFINRFNKSGIHSLNVSLDTLDSAKFIKMTRRDNWQIVWNNIQLLLNNGFHVKLNVVAMKGVNDDEIMDFVTLTEKLPIHVRFIEFMPFEGNLWTHTSVLTARDILRKIQSHFAIQKLVDEKHATAKAYTIEGYKGTFAIISTMSEPFCDGCNRMRLTADGKMKNCLFSKNETNILAALRNGEDIIPLIHSCLFEKEAQLGGQLLPVYQLIDPSQLINRSMIAIGG
ncbi:MAG: GTP 3',8-cyclase MoaA [Ignavibacteria bacterium]|nr:GTP 3',8-cyclase MoaA [Ignavibacteria bacterium]